MLSYAPCIPGSPRSASAGPIPPASCMLLLRSASIAPPATTAAAASSADRGEVKAASSAAVCLADRRRGVMPLLPPAAAAAWSGTCLPHSERSRGISGKCGWKRDGSGSCCCSPCALPCLLLLLLRPARPCRSWCMESALEKSRARLRDCCCCEGLLPASAAAPSAAAGSDGPTWPRLRVSMRASASC